MTFFSVAPVIRNPPPPSGRTTAPDTSGGLALIEATSNVSRLAACWPNPLPAETKRTAAPAHTAFIGLPCSFVPNDASTRRCVHWRQEIVRLLTLVTVQYHLRILLDRC